MPSEFITDDTPLAAHLLTEGYPIVDTVRDGNRVSFVFNNTDPSLHEEIQRFNYLSATSSNAAVLIQNFRTLIARTKSGGLNGR